MGNECAKCKKCEKLLPKKNGDGENFSKKEWKKWSKRKKSPTCKVCVEEAKMAKEERRVCEVCQKPKPKRAYSKTQWDGKTKYSGCKDCRCPKCQGNGNELDSKRRPICNSECQMCKGSGAAP